jgi:hypothetical protein
MPANPFRATVTGLSSNAGNQNSSGFPTYYCDLTRSPFSIGLGVEVNSTGVTWSVQHSFDYLGHISSNFNGFISSAATWFEHSTLSQQSTSAVGNYAFGVSAVRGIVTAGSSTGTVTFNFLQM